MAQASSRQIRAALALLDLPHKSAAKHIGCTSRTIVSDALNGRRNGALARLQAGLEAAGVEFIPGGCRLTPTAGA